MEGRPGLTGHHLWLLQMVKSQEYVGLSILLFVFERLLPPEVADKRLEPLRRIVAKVFPGDTSDHMFELARDVSEESGGAAGAGSVGGLVDQGEGVRGLTSGLLCWCCGVRRTRWRWRATSSAWSTRSSHRPVRPPPPPHSTRQPERGGSTVLGCVCRGGGADGLLLLRLVAWLCVSGYEVLGLREKDANDIFKKVKEEYQPASVGAGGGELGQTLAVRK